MYDIISYSNGALGLKGVSPDIEIFGHLFLFISGYSKNRYLK